LAQVLSTPTNLASHFTILVYPFRHGLPSSWPRSGRLDQLQGRWLPWWARLDGDEVAAALDDTYFFLPYIRNLLFPEVADLSAHEDPKKQEPITRHLQRLSLRNLASSALEDAVLRLTYNPERLAAFRRLQLLFERQGADGTILERFEAGFALDWIDAVLFPNQVGLLLLKVQLAEGQPTVGRLSELLQLLRLVHPPRLGWELARWRCSGPDGELSFRSRDLVDFLLQGLTALPDCRKLTLADWLRDEEAKTPANRFTATPFGQVFGQVFHLYSYACLGDPAAAAEATIEGAGPAPAPLFASPGQRALYEMATCTDTSDPDYVPHRTYLRELWQRNHVALWDNWQGLVLHDNVVFLGQRPHGFPMKALAHNVEYDYFHLYLYALFQKLWLSITFGDMIRPKNWLGLPLPAVRRLVDSCLLFQNRYWFVGSLYLVAQTLDGDAVHLLEEFPYYRFELFQDWGRIVKLCASRKILQVAREIAGDRRKLRKQAAAFMSRFAKAQGIVVAQGVSDRRQVLRDSRLQRLAHFPEQGGIAPAGGQQHRRVEQVQAGGLAGWTSSQDAVDGCSQVGGPDRLGQEIIHAGCEAALAILFP
jgi:hypothetical protein